jgi:hypothetical protein
VNDIGIFFVVEPGKLEYQARVLVKSLRDYGGIDQITPVYAFQPRQSGRITPQTRRFFKDHHVIFEKVNLNKGTYFYPVANKIYAGAHFESTFSSSFKKYLFLDTDLLIQSSLMHLLNTPYKIAVAPAHTSKGLALTDPRLSELWKLVFEIMEVSLDQFWKTRSLFDNQSIYHYYNSGFIFYDPAALLFTKMLEAYKRVISSKQIRKVPYRDFYFLDQVILACLLARDFKRDDVLELPISYNYPLELTQKNIQNAHVIHYQDYFEKNDASELLGHHLKNLVQPIQNKVFRKSLTVRIREILSYQFFKNSNIAQ